MEPLSVRLHQTSWSTVTIPGLIRKAGIKIDNFVLSWHCEKTNMKIMRFSSQISFKVMLWNDFYIRGPSSVLEGLPNIFSHSRQQYLATSRVNFHQSAVGQLKPIVIYQFRVTIRSVLPEGGVGRKGEGEAGEGCRFAHGH